jgi:outer membrane protein assembly factor BamB
VARTTSPNFHQLRSVTVSGAVYAQPLILPKVVIGGTTYANVIYAATEQDWVYAIDAATGTVLWSDNLATYQSGRAYLTAADENNCSNIMPSPGDIGITGTPVIDISQNTSTTAITKGTLYVVSRTKDSTPNYYQTLFAIDITTGKGGGTAGVWTYSDFTGTFTVGSTTLYFGGPSDTGNHERTQNQRGALLAIPSLNPSTDKNPEIIITWGSRGARTATTQICPMTAG